MSKRDWAMKRVGDHTDAASLNEGWTNVMTAVHLLKAERARARRIVRAVGKMYGHNMTFEVTEILKRLQ